MLGAVYEQYLGHIVTTPQAAEVVEKRAKRKSQGIFYTPTFVVKYIVQQTVGKYLAEHGYSESHPPRVLDMACGSGSFLIEAFDMLDRFVADSTPATRAGDRHEVHDHARRLEILQQCIFGVDKDPQAVEVARLNLLLKASLQPARTAAAAKHRPRPTACAWTGSRNFRRCLTPTPALPRSEKHPNRGGSILAPSPVRTLLVRRGRAGWGLRHHPWQSAVCATAKFTDRD